MSFILEALRRANRERSQGTNPDLQQIVEAAPLAPLRRRYPWRAGAGLLLLSAAGAAGLLLWPPADPPSPPPTAEAQTAAKEPVHRPLPVVAVLPAAPAPHQLAADPTAPARLPPPAQAPAPASARPPTPAPAPAPRSGVAPLPPQAQRAPASPLPQEPKNQRPRARDTAEDAAPPASTPPVAPDPGPPSAVPLLETLPPDQQQLFAGTQLNAHVYADAPAKRFVLIQMRSYRVGDTVGNGGPVVEAITREGAVLRAGTVRALVPNP